VVLSDGAYRLSQQVFVRHLEAAGFQRPYLSIRRGAQVRSGSASGRGVNMPESSGVLDPFRNEVAVIAAKYDVAPGRFFPAPQQGEVNLTVCLGESLILRIPRNEAAEVSLAKEAEVINIVQNAGIPTAAVVTYDSSREFVNTPYMVMERLHGRTLGGIGYEADANYGAYTSLAQILAGLHTLRMKDVGPIPHVPEPAVFSSTRLIRGLCDEGELGAIQARWLMDWFDFLGERAAINVEPVLLHGDVLPSNLIVDASGDVTALIDWGCTEWGDPVRDFVDLPTRALPSLLSGYRSARRALVLSGDPLDGDGFLEAGALWYQLFWALAKLRKSPSTSETRNWSVPRQARFMEILRFLTGPLPRPWSDLVRRGPSVESV
jgi:macrolide phosphotransferase